MSYTPRFDQDAFSSFTRWLDMRFENPEDWAAAAAQFLAELENIAADPAAECRDDLDSPFGGLVAEKRIEVDGVGYPYRLACSIDADGEHLNVLGFLINPPM